MEEHLKKWFGYNTFRSYQKEIIQDLLDKKDVLAILPTGAGKSICYQLPAMLLPGTAVVVSPLISLMQDQVAALTKNGIPSAFVNSSLPLPELYDVLRNLSQYKLLYIAPERFSDVNFLERLKEMPLSFFVIDEAHCISQWGHSFRPDYRQLSLIKKNFPDKQMIALTATATPEVEKDIAEQLLMKAPSIIKGSFDRPNLMIRINRKTDPYQQIKTFLKNHPDQSGIIYASTRKTVDALYKDLQEEGYKLGKYHAGLSDVERKTALHDFIHDKTNLMVATVAFGMGINKPDVRFIIHHDMPKTIEQYYQEIGRAGRDGLPAECMMLFGAQDLMIYRFFAKDLTDPILQSQAELKTEAIYSLCCSLKCRRNDLLGYFGEHYSSSGCNCCDNCVDDEEKIEGSVIAQKLLSCVFRLKEGFGIRHVIDVLRGSKNSLVLRYGHDQLSTYNLMSECSEAELRYYIDALLMMKHLKLSDGEYPVLQWTESSRSVIKGDLKVEFRKKIFKESSRKKTSDLPYNPILFNKLRQLRLEVARQEELPPFSIFTDRSLFEMSTYFPQTENEFLSINGIGRYKLENYGDRFLKVIREFCTEHGIAAKSKSREVSRNKSKAPSISKIDSSEESFKLFEKGKCIDEIAHLRGFTKGTIISHICQKIEQGASISAQDVDRVVTKENQELINKVIDTMEVDKLAPIKMLLPESVSYSDIRFMVALKNFRINR